MAIPKKPRKCRVCKTDFQPVRCLQTVCSPECAIKQAQATRSKAERIAAIEDRKIIRAKKEKLKRRGDYIKDAQDAANAYVRYRDKDKPCISCGNPLSAGGTGGGFDAGHYRSRGAAAHLRFDAERNIHGQCKRCNRHLGGNYSEYRVGLIARIGIQAVESLEADNEPRKYTIDDLKAIKATYTAKLKELKHGR